MPGSRGDDSCELTDLDPSGAQAMDAKFMASIYKDLVAFLDEVIVEIDDAMPGFSEQTKRKIRSDTDLLRTERDRLHRCLESWEGQEGDGKPRR
jgi:hypothetical protein